MTPTLLVLTLAKRKQSGLRGPGRSKWYRSMSGSSVDDGVCEVGECEVQLLLYRQFWEELVEEDPEDCRTWGSSHLKLVGRAAAHVLSSSVVRRRGGDLSLTLLIALVRGRVSLIVSWESGGRGSGCCGTAEDRPERVD